MTLFSSRAVTGMALGLGLAALLGCTPRSNKVAISGALTVDGAPGSQATLTFWPSDPNTAEGGSVFTDDQGRFTSGDKAAGTGFAPGEYKVTASRFLDGTGKPARVSGKKSEAGFEAPAKESIPEAYRDRNKTPLTVRIAADAAALELEIKVKK
ncbi:hypothetical protein R5W24_003594 [Gemmata sp. JC717]|uniref:hypothetical protein n=1 Tax=Gemmata algarum TaxID=2975278 RepID=UPI0021BB62CC|nr:hypothetical protein [Gemmata algarum]MDY3554470.1 hypothetical protein [Gemmata algarum]